MTSHVKSDTTGNPSGQYGDSTLYGAGVPNAGEGSSEFAATDPALSDRSASGGAAQAGATIARAAGSVAADLKQFGKEKLNEALGTASQQSNAAKDRVVGEVSNVANALRQAASDLRSGSPQERTLGLIAGGLADASDALRSRDLGEILTDVQNVARRNPALFLGGSVLLGFAAARFTKATAGGVRSEGPSRKVYEGAGIRDVAPSGREWQ